MDIGNGEKPKSKTKGTKNHEEENDDEEEKIIPKKSKRRNKKKQKEEGDDDQAGNDLLNEELIKKGKISESVVNFVYKITYDNAKKRDNSTISLGEFWNVIKANSEAKKIHKIITKAKLEEILSKLEEDEKIFLPENKEITLV